MSAFIILVCITVVYFAWTGIKIHVVYGRLLKDAIAFAYEPEASDVWMARAYWMRPLIHDPRGVIWNPLKRPSDAIYGEFAAEFYAWRQFRRDVQKLIESAKGSA